MKKSAVILNLDTTTNVFVTISLQVDGKEYRQRVDMGTQRLSRLLVHFSQLLAKHHVVWHEITKITVSNTKGSITGIRVGFAVANMLGFLLDIPVNDLPAKENIHPHYGQLTYIDTPEK